MKKLIIIFLTVVSTMFFRIFVHGKINYRILGNFCVAKFLRKWQFNNIVKNIFVKDPCGQYKRHGTAIFCEF